MCGSAGIECRHLETDAGSWKRELLENEKIDYFVCSGSEVLYVVGRRADVQQDASNVFIRSDGKPRVKISDVVCAAHILRLSSFLSISYDGSKFPTMCDVVLPLSISSIFSFFYNTASSLSSRLNVTSILFKLTGPCIVIQC